MKKKEIPRSELNNITSLSNKYARSRMNLVNDEVGQILMSGDITAKDLDKIIGREIALAFAQGFAAKGFYDEQKPKIVKPMGLL